MQNLEEGDLVGHIDWLLEICEKDVSPDAYFSLLSVSKGVVAHVFSRGVPHLAEISDLRSGLSVICLRRRPVAYFGLRFLREALLFREDEYAQPINTSGIVSASLRELTAQIDAAWEARFAGRYSPPSSGAFDHFQVYYSHLCAQEIVADVASMPEAVPLNRTLAVFARLVELACEEFAIPPDERENAARIAGNIEDMIRDSQAPDVVERFSEAAAQTFENARLYAPFRDMAERLKAGEFRRSASST